MATDAGGPMTTKTRAAAPTAPWRSRITGSGEEAPDRLLANPKNWRTHPANQRNALRGSLDTVGWVQQIMVNRTTGHVVDGHARVEEALTRGEATVPVLYVDLSPEEEALVLAALSAHVSLILETDRERRPGAIPLAEQRDVLFARVAELHALEAARTIVEDRYLDGQTALFPDAVRDWADQVRASEEMAIRALRIAELDSAPPLDEAHLGEASDEQVGRCVDDLVEAARIKALDELGDGRAAVSRAIRWLGPRLGAEADGSTLWVDRVWPCSRRRKLGTFRC